MADPRPDSIPRLAMALLVVAGCGPDLSQPFTPEGEPVVERLTLGDTMVVRTLNGSAWGEAMTLEEDLSIGEADGPEEYTFGSVRSLWVTDEQILVLDAGARLVRRYDLNGEYLGDVGRAGNGPGEYLSPRWVGALDDGRIMIVTSRGRINVYSVSGEPLEQILVQSSLSSPDAIYLDSNSAAVYAFDRESSGEGLERTVTNSLQRVPLDGAEAEEVPLPTERMSEPSVVSGSIGGTFGVRLVLGFRPREHWALTRSGELLRANSGAYAIEIFHEDGTILRMERRHTPIPFHPDELSAARPSEDAPPAPDFKPVFWKAFVNADGSIWVRMHTEAVEKDNPSYDPSDPESKPRIVSEPRVYEVFEPDGSFVGALHLPDDRAWGLADPVRRDEFVWATTRDSLGVERVVRFEVVPDTGS